MWLNDCVCSVEKRFMRRRLCSKVLINHYDKITVSKRVSQVLWAWASPSFSARSGRVIDGETSSHRQWALTVDRRWLYQLWTLRVMRLCFSLHTYEILANNSYDLVSVYLFITYINLWIKMKWNISRLLPFLFV